MFIHILTLDKHNVRFGTSLTVSIKMIMNDFVKTQVGCTSISQV